MSTSQRKIQAPYIGLRPFDEADHPIFFGREDQVMSMLEVLTCQRFLAVVGSSGSGKSSLVRAGLVPAIRRGFLAGTKDWLVVPPVKPGNAPYANLAASLLECLPILDLAEPTAGSGEPQTPGLDALVERLRASDLGLFKVLQGEVVPAEKKILLIIDQFEEIFSFRRPRPGKTGYASRDEAAAFVNMLLRACRDNEGRIWVVLTMRSDFIGQCEAFLGLPEKVSSCQFLVPRLTRRQMTEAIIYPLFATGVDYPAFKLQDGLANHIINDAGDKPDQLPLMQHALMRAWKLAAVPNDERKMLTFHAYQELAGGLHNALDWDANTAWREVLDKAASGGPKYASMPEITRQMFLLLCEESIDGQMIRHRPLVRDVLEVTGSSQELLEEVLRIFQKEDRNLVLPSLDDHCLLETDAMDISHEAILRQWRIYRDEWQDKERRDVAQLRDLHNRVQFFKETPTRVLSSDDLDAFQKWKASKVSAWALRYVKTEDWLGIDELFKISKEKLWLAKLTTATLKVVTIASIIGGALVALIAGGYALQQSREVARAVANTRLTLSLQSFVGNSGDRKPSTEEIDALWKVSELLSEHEQVRNELLQYWFSGSSEFSRGALSVADGVDVTVGTALERHEAVEMLAPQLASKMIKDSTHELYSSDEFWSSLAKYLKPSDTKTIVDALLSFFENRTDSSVGPSIAVFAARLDAVAIAPLADRLVKMLENPQGTDSYSLSSLASSLAALTEKLDAVAAVPLLQKGAERLVKALENPQETDVDRLSSLASSLAALTEKLDAVAAVPLLQKGAERVLKALENPLETDHDRVSSLASSLAALTEKLDAAAAAPLAVRILKALENPQETNSYSLFRLARLLAALTEKIDAAAVVPLLQKGAERLVKALENPQETDSYSLSSLASSLAALTEKLDAAAAAPLLQKGVERLLKALENTPETASSRLSSLASSLEALTEKLDAAATRSAILLKAMAAVISKWRDSQKSVPKASLLIHLCDWAQALSDKDIRQITIQCVLQQLQSSDIPELENEDGPVIEPREREIVRKACLALTLPQLANLLKAPLCRGELQKLVLLALEQKTNKHFDGDLWKFVEAAATECYAGVDLDGPVKRIRLEEVIAEVSKHVPIPEAKPKASSQQP